MSDKFASVKDSVEDANIESISSPTKNKKACYSKHFREATATYI